MPRRCSTSSAGSEGKTAPKLLIRRQKPPAAAKKPNAPAPGTAPAGVDPNADVDELKQDMSDLRDDIRRWGAAIGAAATAVLGGIGWTQSDRLFPLAPVWWLATAAIVSTLAAVGGSVGLFMRIFGAQRRILIGTTPSETTGLNDEERRAAWKYLDEQARLEHGVHISDVDARQLRLDRAATRLELTGDPLAPTARKESDRLALYVGLALRRAALNLLEKRARKAITGFWAWTLLMVAAFGIAGLFAVSNYSQGQRQQAPANKALACLKTVDSSGTAAGWEQITLDEGCAKLVAP